MFSVATILCSGARESKNNDIFMPASLLGGVASEGTRQTVRPQDQRGPGTGTARDSEVQGQRGRRDSGGPSMYEMEGPPSRLGALASRLLGGRCAAWQPPGIGHRQRSPVARHPQRSPGLPRNRPAFGGERISTASSAGRTRCSASKCKILLAVHRTCCAYPPESAAQRVLSTAPCTAR